MKKIEQEKRARREAHATQVRHYREKKLRAMARDEASSLGEMIGLDETQATVLAAGLVLFYRKAKEAKL